jgi:hypothetical protein
MKDIPITAWLSNTSLIVILIVLNLVCYYRTLFGYFLADDFIHISYLANVIDKHPETLFLNFVSNWMQAYGTTFYRPLISLSLAFDYWLGHGNPLIFHISNTCFHILCSIVLYFLVSRLLKGYQQLEIRLVAFFSGALFAVFPLHPEVVSWVIGRVDSICTLFYLCSFWLYIVYVQDKSQKAFVLSIIAFILSLTSKEMAITLPICLFTYQLFANFNKQSITRQLYSCIGYTWPYFIVLAIYFLVRFLALGQIVGGYSGSIGEGLSQSFISRWFNFDYAMRVIFPFNQEIFTNNKLANILSKFYVGVIIIALARTMLLKNIFSWNRWLLFSIVWFIISMLPTYQVWNLTPSLQGSRFIYLGSAPLCLILPFALFPFLSKIDVHKSQFAKGICILSIALLCAFVAVFAMTTYKNNLPWAHASKQVRTFRESVEQVLNSLPENKKLVILNIPQRIEGAHMLYNAAMLSVLLSPPLSIHKLHKRVITFEPVTYGDSDLIVISRLKRIAHNNNYAFYKWDPSTTSLIEMKLAQKTKLTDLQKTTNSLNQSINEINKVGNTLHLTSPQFELAPLDVDFVKIEASSTPIKTDIPMRIWLSWASQNKPGFSPERRLSLPFITDGLSHSYIFPVSEHKSWVKEDMIIQLDLEFPFLAHQQISSKMTNDKESKRSANCIFSIDKISFQRADNIMPKLAIEPFQCSEDLDGVCHSETNTFNFNYDASQIPLAHKVKVEISRPNAWFEHYTGTYRNDSFSKYCLSSFTLESKQGKFQILPKEFPEPAYYQVRVFALNKNGSIIGYCSDPVNLQVSSQK